MDIDIIEQLPGYFLQKDISSKYIYGNNNTAKLFGFDKPYHLTGITDHEIRCDAADYADIFIWQDQKLLERKEPVKFLDFHPYQDGGIKCLIIVKTLYNHNHQQSILCHCTEIDNTVLSHPSVKFDKQQTKYFNNTKNEAKCYYLNSDFDLGLSKRQAECLFYLLRGKSNKEIGLILNISHRTVEAHIDQIKLKFNCITRSELFEFSINKGLLNVIPPHLIS